MSRLHSLLIMMIISFVIQYYIMSLIMANNLTNITNSLGKLYISLIMAIIMGLVEVIMYDSMYMKISWNYYIWLLIPLGILLVMYREQKFILDKQYLKEMIEHHSMAVRSSSKIIEKTSDYKVKALAHNIKISQQNEIEYMKKLLQEIKN